MCSNCLCSIIVCLCILLFFFFFKQKTAYELRISDWSSDVCSSDLLDFAWRWHRWVRGDWQILPWLFPFVPGRDGRWLRNRFGWLDRLKLFDNLRRSLIPFSIVALLLGGWFLLHAQPRVWTLLALAAPAAYLFTDPVHAVARGRRRGVMPLVLRRQADQLGRWALALTFFVYEHFMALLVLSFTPLRLASA